MRPSPILQRGAVAQPPLRRAGAGFAGLGPSREPEAEEKDAQKVLDGKLDGFMTAWLEHGTIEKT